MRSRIEEINSLLPNAYERGLSAATLARLAREYRAIMIGALIADAIVWCAHVPQRLLRAWKYGRRPQRVSRAEYLQP